MYFTSIAKPLQGGQMKCTHKKKKYIISTKNLSKKRKKELHEQYLSLIINQWNCRERYKMRNRNKEMRSEPGRRPEATMPLHHRLRKNKKNIQERWTRTIQFIIIIPLNKRQR